MQSIKFLRISAFRCFSLESYVLYYNVIIIPIPIKPVKVKDIFGIMNKLSKRSTEEELREVDKELDSKW